MNKMKNLKRSIQTLTVAAAGLLAFSSPVVMAASDQELAKKSQNPVAKLISLPFENNINGDYGPNDSTQNVLNIKPVIPQAIGEDWNWIHRTIFSVVSQPGLPNNSNVNRTNGLGDTTYQGFLSPSSPGSIIWGVGPSVQVPTHTDEVLGNKNWAAGPAVVVLTMPGPWVLGGVVSQIWDFAESGNDGSDADISLMVAQPFVNYNFKSGWYLSTAPVISSNWEANSSDKWTVPVGGGIGKIVRWGKQPINLKLAYYYNVEKPEVAADWDLQLTAIWLFPK